MKLTEKEIVKKYFTKKSLFGKYLHCTDLPYFRYSKEKGLQGRFCNLNIGYHWNRICWKDVYEELQEVYLKKKKAEKNEKEFIEGNDLSKLDFESLLEGK